MSYFSNHITSLMNKNLNGLWARQQVTMENLANSSTPNYKGKYVDFEHELQNKIDSLRIKGIAQGNIKASELESGISDTGYIVGENNNKTLRLDGNNVDVERESLELARTQINYSYTIAELNSYFIKMKLAISGMK